MKSKKTLKIVTKVFLCFVILVSLLYVGGGLFSSVNFDSGACAGGFHRYVVDENKEEFERLFGCKIEEEDIWQIADRISYEGRNIYAEFTDENGKEHRLNGRKVWYCKYKWEKADVN